MHEPISTLVYGGAQANVNTVVIDGKVVLEKGSFATIDEREFAREVHERAIALSKRIGTFRLMEGRRFTPFQYDRTSRVAPRMIADAENGRVAVPPQIEDAQLVSPRDGHAE
jgi:hypothetical protein